MKHLICTIDRTDGTRTITMPDGYQLLRVKPDNVYVAHKQAWSDLMRLYDELVRGEELATDANHLEQ
jgi:hypothetical protein